MILQPSLLRGPTTLYRVLCDFLELKDFRYEMAPGSNRQTKCIGHCFFTDPEDRLYALSCLDSLRQPATGNIAASSPNNPVPAPTIQAPFNDFHERKAAHNISQRFKKEERITGKLGESVHESLANYVEACEAYGLNEAQKLQYLHNLFDGEAKQFFRAYVQNMSNCNQIAAQKMILELNNITRQNRVRKYLQGLEIQSIMQKEKCNVNDGLEKIRNIISRYSPH